jgi:hypothetical protein
MIYLTDSLKTLLESCSSQPFIETEMVRPQEVRKLFKMLTDLNSFLQWRLCIVENCVQTERAAKEFSKILKREIVPNQDCKPKLEKGDVMIYLEFAAGKPMLYLKKVTGV